MTSDEAVHRVSIREIRPDDAEAFLALRRHLDGETHYMLLEPGERTTTLEEQRRHLEELAAQEQATIFVAEQSGLPAQLVGYLEVSGGPYRRISHTAYIVVGIRQDFTGRGLGRRLFQSLEDWARRRDFHRLELTVMTHNTRAVALYQKLGFVIEGTRREALLIDGQYRDEYYMAKLLS